MVLFVEDLGRLIW